MKVLTGEISYMYLSIFFSIHPYISIYSCDVPFCRIIKAASTRLQLGSSVKRAVRGGGKSKIFPSETRTRTIHMKISPLLHNQFPCVHPECSPVNISDHATLFMCSSIQFVSVETCTDMSTFMQVRQRVGHHRKRLRKVMASYLSIYGQIKICTGMNMKRHGFEHLCLAALCAEELTSNLHQFKVKKIIIRIQVIRSDLLIVRCFIFC